MALWHAPRAGAIRPWYHQAAVYGAGQLGRYVRSNAASWVRQGVKRAREATQSSRPAKRRMTHMPGRMIAARSGSRRLKSTRIFRKSWRRKPYGVSRRVRRTIKGIAGSMMDTQTNTKRDVGTFQHTHAANQCQYDFYSLGNCSQLNSAVSDAHMPYVDSDAIGIVTDMNLANLTGADYKIKFLNMMFKLQIRNNGQMPVKLNAWWVKPKKDTNTNPTQSLTKIDVDGDDNTFSITDPRYMPYDAPGFRNEWKVYKSGKYILNAGDEVELIVQRKNPRWYDPREFTANANEYVKGMYLGLFMRTEGVPAHDDTTTSNVGLSDGTLDIVKRTHFKFSTMKGVKMHRVLEGTGDFDTLTTAVVAGPDVEEIKEAL